MESQKQIVVSVSGIRQAVVHSLTDDANQTFSSTRGEQLLTELRRHINLVFRQVARLKLLDAVPLTTGNAAVEVFNEGDSNKERLDHMRVVADAMFYLNEDIKQWNVPQFEIQTAFSSLVNGGAKIFPSVIDELAAPVPLSKTMSENMLNCVSTRILRLLNTVKLRTGTRIDRVAGGTATLSSPGEFEVKLTLKRSLPARTSCSTRDQGTSELHDSTALPCSPNAPERGDTLSFDLDIADTSMGQFPELEREWLWSLSDVRFFIENEDGSSFFENFQLEFLRREFQLRLDNIASVEIADRAEHEAPAEHRFSDTTQHTDGESVLEEPATLAKGKEPGPDGALQSSKSALNLLFDLCRDVVNRVSLHLIRSALKELVSGTGPFRGSSKMVVSETFKPGYRLLYWIGVPVIVDAVLQGTRNGDQWVTPRPFVEIGVSSKGYVEIQHFTELHSGSNDSVENDRMAARSSAGLLDLLMRLTGSLADKVLVSLLGELRKRIAIVEEDDLLFELSRPAMAAASPQKYQQGTGFVCSLQSIRCLSHNTLLIVISISLPDGRLRLDTEHGRECDRRSKLDQFEENLNRNWRKTAKVKTAETLHPHLLALEELSRGILDICKHLQFSAAGERSVARSVKNAVYGHQKPIRLPSVLKSAVLENTWGTLTDQLTDQSCNVPLRRLVFKSSGLVEKPEFQSVLRCQLIIHIAHASSEERTGRFLVLLVLDHESIPAEVAAVVPIPQNSLQGRWEVKSTGRKRKVECTVLESNKREKVEHEADSSVASLLTDACGCSQNGQDAVEDDLMSNASGRLGTVATEAVYTEEEAEWCSLHGLLEALKMQLIALDVVLMEEIALVQSGDHLHSLRISGCRYPQFKIDFSGIGEVVLRVEKGGLAWYACIADSDVVQNLLLYQSSGASQSPNLDLHPGFEHSHLLEDTNLFGSAYASDSGITLVYTCQQSAEQMLFDLQIVSQMQVFLKAFQSEDSLSQKHRKWSIGQKTCSAVYHLGLAEVRLSAYHTSQFTIPALDSERMAVDWTIRLSVQPQKDPVAHESHMGAGIKERSRMQTKPFVQTTPQDQRASQSSAYQTAAHSHKERAVDTGLVGRRNKEIGRKGNAARGRISFQLSSSVRMPTGLLSLYEQLLRTNQFDNLFRAIRLTSATLFCLHSFWQTSSWKLYVLPHSNALSWNFLCTQEKQERLLTMRFHESGFLFIRVCAHSSSETDLVDCKSTGWTKDVAQWIETVLQKSVSKARRSHIQTKP